MNGALGTRRSQSVLPVTVFSVGLVYLALRKIGSIGDTDVWWHLKTGDLIRNAGSVPNSDPFSWTATGESWHPNAWMSDALFSWLRELAGLTALSVYRSVGVLMIGILMWIVLQRQGEGRWSSVAAVFLCILLMMPFITERPQVVGFVAFTILMLLIPNALRGSSIAVIGLGALMAVWANLHGSFIMGVGVVGLAAAGSVASGRRWRTPMITVVTVLLAPLIHPYGFGVFSQALAIPGVSSFIEEWRSFDLGDPRDRLIALFALAAFLGSWRTGRWEEWGHSLPLLALAAITARAIRTAPFLLMWGAPYFAGLFSSSLVPRLRAWATARAQPIGAGLLVAVLVLSGTMVREIPGAGSIDLQRVPIAEVDALPADCRLLNEYEFGGVLIDRRWPELLVSQDGRNDLYGLERIELQESWFEDGDLASLDQQGITCVMARPNRSLTTKLRSEPAWEILSESDLAVAFAKVDM